MRRIIRLPLLMIFGVLLASPVWALQSFEEAIKKVYSGCGNTRESGTMAIDGGIHTLSISSTGCVNGKRDGPGTTDWEISSRETTGDLSWKNVSRHEGEFANGVEAGLWCITRVQSFGKLIEGTTRPDLRGCYLVGEDRSRYRKLPDGRWQLMTPIGTPADPAVFVAAGSLEKESDRLLALARGSAGGKTSIVVQSQILDDLVRGSKIVLAPGSAPVSLKDKRIALVLSSNMVAELERFRRERQALIQSTSSFAGERAKVRADFVAASDPDRLLTNVAKVLRRNARDVQPFDESLGRLTAAGFDYALVLDWKYTTRLDLQGKYSDFPVGSYEDMRSGKIPSIKGESMAAFLVAPDLKAIRQLPGAHHRHPKHTGGTGMFGTGDSGYLFDLTQYYGIYFGRDADDEGLALSEMKRWLALLK